MFLFSLVFTISNLFAYYAPPKNFEGHRYQFLDRNGELLAAVLCEPKNKTEILVVDENVAELTESLSGEKDIFHYDEMSFKIEKTNKDITLVKEFENILDIEIDENSVVFKVRAASLRDIPKKKAANETIMALPIDEHCFDVTEKTSKSNAIEKS